MKHRVAGRWLDRTTEHRTAMFKNMVTSLLRHERIVTTTPKAKELRRIADRIITLGKRGTPHARRRAHRSVRDVEVLDKLFGPIAQRFRARPGGYTDINDDRPDKDSCLFAFIACGPASLTSIIALTAFQTTQLIP